MEYVANGNINKIKINYSLWYFELIWYYHYSSCVYTNDYVRIVQVNHIIKSFLQHLWEASDWKKLVLIIYSIKFMVNYTFFKIFSIFRPKIIL